MGLGSDEDEQRGRRYGLGRPRGVVVEGQAGESAIAVAVDGLGVVAEGEVGRRLQLPVAVDDVGAEPDGLVARPVGQLGAADAAGEPQVVRIIEVVPACPPVASGSSRAVPSPSEALYMAAASPAGPAPTTVTS